MNKQFLKVGLVALMAGMYSAGASAAGPVVGTADAKVVAAVTLTKNTDMNFGSFVPDDTNATTVTLTDESVPTRTMTNGTGVGTLAGGTVTSAQFTITGETNSSVGITITDLNNDLTDGTNFITFTPGAGNLPASHTISATAASNVLYIGGSIGVPINAPAGAYTQANAYEVTVDYN